MSYSVIEANLEKLARKRNFFLIRCKKNGISIYMVLLKMQQFGSNADAIKESLDRLFKKLFKFVIKKEQYMICLVSCTADGACVNMRIYWGVFTQMKKRPWLSLFTAQTTTLN